jgi:hypothetical protein
MSGKLPPESERYLQYHIGELFCLCEAWIASDLADAAFSEATLKLQKDILNANWGDRGFAGERRLRSRYNLAVQCCVAIEQTMWDLKMHCQSKSPPMAMKAFYFAKRVSSDAILELEKVLRMERSPDYDPKQSLADEFRP